MPMYDWQCQKCDKWEATVHPIEERDTPPEETKSKDGCEHSWKRHISGKQSVVKAARWGAGKGNW